MLLPEEAVQNVREQIRLMLHESGWLTDEQDAFELVSWQAFRQGSPGWWRLYEQVQTLDPGRGVRRRDGCTGARCLLERG